MDLECLLIADDLTGACDAAVQFAVRGLRVRVSLDWDGEAGQTDVLAISTESRDADMGSFREALRRLPPLQPRMLFKKIDSTLRGNVGREVAAALAAFDCDVAVVTPAFPAMGRTVEGGYLRIAGEIGFVPRELAASFRDLPAADTARLRLLDATCDAGLDAIVSEALALPRRILWAGSAGLAAALARATGSGTPVGFAFAPAPSIFCLGSDHAVTMEQQHRLISNAPPPCSRRIRPRLKPSWLRGSGANRWCCASGEAPPPPRASANCWQTPPARWCSPGVTRRRWSAALSTPAPSNCGGRSLPASPVVSS